MNSTIPYRLNDPKLLQEFIALLLRKGYDGSFMLQSLAPPAFYTGPIEICLQKFIDSCKGVFPTTTTLTLTTDFGKEDRSPPYFTAISVQFNPDKGWLIQHLLLRQFGISKETRINIPLNNDLPAFKHLPHLMHPGRRSPILRAWDALVPKRKI